MALTGFQRANDAQRTEADALHTLGSSSSPYLHGVELTIVGHDYDFAEIDGKVAKDAKPQPVFKAKIGEDEYSLFVRPLMRNAVKSDGTVLKHDGTFNTFVAKTIAENRTLSNGELLSLIVKAVEGKTIVVRRTPYSALSKDGRTYASDLVDYDFKVD